MLFYCGYLLAQFGALILPRPIAYGLGRFLARLYCQKAREDRKAVRENLKLVLGTDQVSERQVREVFENFALYLVDFFQFGRLNQERIQNLVQIEGLDRVERILKEGRGVIGITAHLGNFELAGAVLSLSGFSVHAAVFTHQNQYVDCFFRSQRERVGVHGISVDKGKIKNFFVQAIAALKSNGLLALVSDRDFFGLGIDLPFFGKTLQVPTGPAAFSLRSGAPIVPVFLVREQDGSYRFICEEPIVPPQGLSREDATRKIMEQCAQVMARYIQAYPTQWYMFQPFWKPVTGVIL